MTMVEPGGAVNLVNRVRNIILHPKAEWDRIKTESTSLQTLLIGYVLPLVAFAAVCGFIGMAVFGVPMGFGTWRVPMQFALGTAIVQVVLGLVMVWVLGLIINAIAPSFGSTQDQMQANKVAAYFPTAGWLAGVFGLFPPISLLSIVGLYSLYLLWVGLPKLMNTPEDKKVGYFATVLVIAILAAFVLGMAAAAVQRMAMPSVVPPSPF